MLLRRRAVRIPATAKTIKKVRHGRWVAGMVGEDTGG
jgi:hypothetical protein